MECVNVMEILLYFFGVICYADYGDSAAVSFVIFMVTMLLYKSKVCMKLKKKRSNSEVSTRLNSTPDIHSVITHFQKIYQQLNFGVQGRSICIIISLQYCGPQESSWII
jgi:hypothetical protein